MRPLRGLLGAVLWILACVLGLVALVFCVTVILLPVGVPVLGVARRFFTRAVQLMLPRSLTHPVDEVTKTVTKKGRRARSEASGMNPQRRIPIACCGVRRSPTIADLRKPPSRRTIQT
jgi:hypothetical protein